MLDAAKRVAVNIPFESVPQTTKAASGEVLLL